MKMFFQWVAPAEGVSSITLVNTPAPGIHHHLFFHTSPVYNFITLHYSVLHPINLEVTINHLIAPGAPPRKQDNNVIDNNNNHLIDPSRCLTWTSPSTGWLTRTSNRTQSSTSSLLASLGDHLYHDYHHRHWVTVFIMIKHLQRSSSSFLFLCIF